ncbi:hypothetical protein PF010_g3687 [Phytophthora fragariae]|uniref:Uncharacterized protein n=1 Tax=Phytophthora fragariae TaxID=53985 RepID=A0A6G0LV07_9STRA|nr:hypothetical protein PF010_g3687 [Phytophthora fragariae]
MKAPATQRAQPLKQDWRISFGFWTELDALYHAYPPPSKPRCPALPHDSASEWRKRLIPDDIERFLSNPAAAACLRTVSSNIDDDAATGFTNFIISGGSCTGKSTFAGILRKTLVGLTADLPCRFATLNASGIAEKSLPSKLEDTVKRLDASKAGAPSYLTIEHFESVSPSVQQHFFVPLLAEANSKRVFVILLVRPDANKLAEQIKAQAMKIYLHALSANFVRIKLLLVCQQESIGYTREGLEELTKLFSFKLMPCLEKLHEIFVKQYFISQANVFKMIQSASDTDLETQRYLFARDRGKAAEWGGAKKAADEQMARMDAGLNSAHDNINRLEQELSSRQEALEKLQDAIVHGSSKGLGKGHGRIEGKPEDKQL